MTSAAPAITVNSPNGMLTRKIGRQSRPQKLPAIKRPPTTGPATEAKPALSPNSEKARLRSRGGNITWAIDSTCGVITEPARPCRMRAPIRSWIEGAIPQRNEPSVNNATPIRNICLRPTMSPSRPKGNRPSA